MADLNALQRFGLALSSPQSYVNYGMQQDEIARQEAEKQRQLQAFQKAGEILAQKELTPQQRISALSSLGPQGMQAIDAYSALENLGMRQQQFDLERGKMGMDLQRQQQAQSALQNLQSLMGVQPQGAVPTQGYGPQIPITPETISSAQQSALLNLAQYDPSAANTAISTIKAFQPKTPETVVNVNNAQESEFAKKQGESLSKYVDSVYSSADQSLKQLNLLQQFSALMEAGAQTGFGAEYGAKIKNIAQAAGFDIGDAGPTEAARSLANQFALQIRNPDSGMGLPGASSNRDLDFLLNIVPNLANTPAGNRMILKIAAQTADIKQQVANYADSLLQDNNGKVPPNFRKSVRDYEFKLSTEFAKQIRPELESFSSNKGYSVNKDGVYILD